MTDETSTWFTLDIEIEKEAADALSEELADRYDTWPVSFERPGYHRMWLQLYFSDRNAAEEASAYLQTRDDVAAVRIRRSSPRDWSSFWRHHAKAMDIGEGFRILPVIGDDPMPEAPVDRIPLFIRTGLSFGTGDHFTTRFCLEALERTHRKQPVQSMMDIGCGSGILTVAAGRLGAGILTAVDHDELCIRHTNDNLAMNGITGASVFMHDILEGPAGGPHDVVAANILSGILMEAAPAIIASTGRALLLSGIREIEVDAVADTYRTLGLRETGRDGDGEWAGILLEK